MDPKGVELPAAWLDDFSPVKTFALWAEDLRKGRAALE